jgi:AraC family transcriptional regulator
MYEQNTVAIGVPGEIQDRRPAIRSEHLGRPKASTNPTAKDVPELVPGGLAPWQVKRLVYHIDTRIGEKLTLDRLARLVRLSTSYFSAAFKRSFGTSPYAYILARRVEFAKEQIANGASSLCQVALDCGLADQAHLSRVFRRLTGMTPSAWRKTHVSSRRGSVTA